MKKERGNSMNADTFMLLFDAIIMFYGLYMIYSGYQMKKTHQPPNLVINPAELIGARDVKGFCDAMFKPLILFGVVAVVYGIVGLINDLYAELPVINFLSVGVFLVLCFWFLKETKKYKAKYLK